MKNVTPDENLVVVYGEALGHPTATIVFRKRKIVLHADDIAKIRANLAKKEADSPSEPDCATNNN